MKKYVGTKTVKVKKDIYELICNGCLKVISQDDNYSPITISFPFGHRMDSVDGDSELCSDECVIRLINKSIKENGKFQMQMKDTNV